MPKKFITEGAKDHIWWLYERGWWTQQEIADYYGVSKRIVNWIVNGREIETDYYKNRKLNKAQKEHIEYLHKEKGESVRKIAKKYGVSAQTISLILRGKIYGKYKQVTRAKAKKRWFTSKKGRPKFFYECPETEDG